MPKYPKPFFRTVRNAWFVQLGKRQVNLGPDEAEALRRYHELMIKKPGAEDVAVASESALSVLDAFLDWCAKHKARRTYDWYLKYLESFAKTLPAGIRSAELKPFHVQRWLDDQATWKTGKRGAVIAVQRAFNWAVRIGLLAANPVRGVEKPRAGRRDKVISPEEFRAILARVRDEEFRDLLAVCWETGCRPQEALAVEARHVDLENGCWVFPADEAKGKEHPRVVYLTDGAVEITTRLMARRPVGPLFRNTEGAPWTPYCLNCRFGRLRLALGRARLEELRLLPPKLKRLKEAQRNDPSTRGRHNGAVMERRKRIADLARHHGPRYSLYTLRHSWCTHALERGLDAVTVSVLMGHRDTTMISRVYSHLTQRREHLREAVRKVVRAVDEGA